MPLEPAGLPSCHSSTRRPACVPRRWTAGTARSGVGVAPAGPVDVAGSRLALRPGRAGVGVAPAGPRGRGERQTPGRPFTCVARVW